MRLSELCESVSPENETNVSCIQVCNDAHANPTPCKGEFCYEGGEAEWTLIKHVQNL